MPTAWDSPRSQGFGPTDEPLDGPYGEYAHFNKGIDFAAAAGTPVPANIEGTVLAVGNQNDGWGYSVKVVDAQGNVHNYGHLDPKIAVNVGQKITKGTLLGKVGGKIPGEASTGPHLSYDVRDKSGKFFDPESFVSGASKTPANARMPVGDAIRPVTPDGGGSKPTGGGTKIPYTIGGGQAPTGDYESRASAYREASEKAYRELADYQFSSDDLLIPDEEEGVVYKWDPSVIDPETGETVGGLVLDEAGTRMLQQARAAENQLERLYAAKKAGVERTGEESAAAFVAAEKEKAADASNDYEDYIRRISDLTAIEDIPTSRAAQFASTMATINKNKTPYTISGGMGASGRPQMTDLNPFISSMRSVIPKQAPAPYDIPPEVFDMTKIDPTRIPARPPEEILGEIGLQPQVPQQQPLIPRIDQPKVANVGRTVGDLIQGLLGKPSAGNPMQDTKNKWPIIGTRYR